MISRRSLFGVTGALIASQSASAASARAANGRRSSEVLAFRDFAQKTHPMGAMASADKDWHERWASLAKNADSLGDGSYFIALRKALGWFKDGHSTVLPFQFTGGVPGALSKGPFRLNLPLKMRAFHDGLLVVEASGSALPLLGARIVRIGSLESAEFVRRIADGWPGNAAWAHRWSAMHATVPAFLHAVGAIEAPEAPVFMLGTIGEGRQVEANIQSFEGAGDGMQSVPRKTSLIEQWLGESHGANFVRRVPDSNALLLSIEAMEDIGDQSFLDFSRDAISAMNEAGPARLIVDLRRNGGGNNFFFEPLRKAILASRYNSPGQLIILTGVQTFSAAQNLATRLERDSHALFVGEPTGGAPNHYGDAKTLQGAETGLTAMVSSLPWFDSYPMDRREWIMPDVQVLELSGDWLTGRDLAFKAASQNPPAAGPGFTTMDRTFYFRRPGQDKRWTPFWLS